MENNTLSGLWVYCESTADGLRSVAYELLGEAARLAKKAHLTVTAAVIGENAEALARDALRYGADNALAVPCDQADELTVTDNMASLIGKYRPAMLLLGATSFGRSLAPRLAARLRTGLTADCTSLDISEDGLLLQTRPAFGGHLLATITCPDRRPQMATVRPRVFSAPKPDDARTGNVILEDNTATVSPVALIEKMASRETVNIGSADILVSVGQGIGSAENIALAERLAEKLGGMLSASRPMVDSGLMPYARQVGQTGKTVSPRLYIALGISGAVQHMAGVAAENIVAVNIDPDAHIMGYARYAVVCDCGAFLRETLDRLG